MKSWFSRGARASAGVLLSAWLAACGGGGGGGSAGPAAAESIALSLASAAAIKEETFAGAPHSTRLELRWTGDANALAGRPISVVIEMPDSALYQAKPQVVQGAGFASVALAAEPAGWSTEGHYTGTMLVRACLDAECRTQLANSPLAIPYDIRIKPRLKLSTTTLDLRSSYGAAPPSATVTVRLPEGATEWNIAGGADIASKQGDVLVVRPPAFLPSGSYTQIVVVSALVVPANGDATQRSAMQEFINVDYSVAPSAYIPFKMFPTSMDYSLWLNDPMQWREQIQLTAPDGSFALRGIRIDRQPAAAVGHPSLATWLTASDAYNFLVSPCGLGPTPACLPLGAYTSSVMLQHTSSGGAITYFDLPVTINIIP